VIFGLRIDEELWQSTQKYRIISTACSIVATSDPAGDFAGTVDILFMAHEDLSRDQEIEGSSDRSFGLVFAVVFLVIALWPLWHGATPRWWAVIVAAVFAVIAWLRPTLLARPNRLWMKLGVLLGKIVSPIALGILFYGVLAPLGAIMRLAGKDPLSLKHDAAASSYWVQRKPPGPPPDSMTNQF